METRPEAEARSLRIAGAFAGIGGVETGLTAAGHRAVALIESWDPARAVLSAHLGDVQLLGDIAGVSELPEHDVFAAGFPCNDLSAIGAKAGITGPHSGLVEHVFRLAKQTRPEWILLENVPNLLVLHGGAPMRMIVSRLEALGYSWAYRVVDSRFTGVPQRRRRVVILANRDRNPAGWLLAPDAGPPAENDVDGQAFGFYWTEGRGGLGWARDAIPTLKGGSTIGLPSAPAVWLPGRDGPRVVIPSIGDGERLQGFESGWTLPAAGRPDHRWKLVGNAVTVGVARWVGDRLAGEHDDDVDGEPVPAPLGPWPDAGWGGQGRMWSSPASPWPVRLEYTPLRSFLTLGDARPLSHRAALGFLRRLDASSLRPDEEFVRDVEAHARAQRPSLPRSRAKESWASSPAARTRMRANRATNTKPELALRRELFARGLRYRIHTRPNPTLRNRVDLCFRPVKVAVEVRGCFWHACPEHGTLPKANADHWTAKLSRNQARDAEVAANLAAAGWHLEVVWEHEETKTAADRVERVVRSRRPR